MTGACLGGARPLQNRLRWLLRLLLVHFPLLSEEQAGRLPGPPHYLLPSLQSGPRLDGASLVHNFTCPAHLTGSHFTSSALAL